MKCPTCGQPIAPPPANRSFPFCSPRCKLADLGDWLSGSVALDPETGSIERIDPDEAVEVVLDDEPG